jgi:hypothetical protein
LLPAPSAPAWQLGGLVEHIPAAQKGLEPEHDELLCHWPVASHVCGVLPAHCFELGVQTPVQVPALHT